MKTAIIVDFQNDFTMIDGALYVNGSIPAMWNVVKLLESGEIDQVVFTVDWHSPNHCSFKENGGEWPRHCVQFSDGAAIQELLLNTCLKQDISYKVLNKGIIEEEYGAFEDIDYDYIDEVIRYTDGDGWEGEFSFNNETDYIIICGVAGDYCVKETIMNLECLENNLVIFEDGIASIDGGTALTELIENYNLATCSFKDDKLFFKK